MLIELYYNSQFIGTVSRLHVVELHMAPVRTNDMQDDGPLPVLLGGEEILGKERVLDSLLHHHPRLILRLHLL